MKIIFLDFDGVLNSTSSLFLATYGKGDGTFVSKAAPNPISVQAVEWLIENADAHIVVSSSWRQGLTLEGLRDVLEHDFGSRVIAERVIDKTKNTDIHEMRGHQIKHWIDFRAKELGIEVEKYVILDDDSDMLPKQKKHFVQTNLDSGFTVKDCEKAIEILGLDMNALMRGILSNN